MESARRKGVDAHTIECETFDELMGDIVSVVTCLADVDRDRIAKIAPRVGNAPVPDACGTWPVIRMNALPILEAPTSCRLIDCNVGGTGEIRDRVKAAGVDLIVGRRQSGVIAFGRNGDALRAFEPLGIRRFDLLNIETHRLRYDSAEHGLLYEAIVKALSRMRPLVPRRRHGRWAVCVETEGKTHDLVKPLEAAVGNTHGRVGDMTWTEAAWLTLDYRMGRLWLVFEPMVWLESGESPLSEEAKDFRRSRLTGRYNAAWNAIVDAWAHILVNGESSATLSAYGIDDGIDARFVVSGITAYTKRMA